MSRSTLLGLMVLYRGRCRPFPVAVTRRGRSPACLGDALPGLTETGLQVVGLCLLGVALLCLAGWLRSDLPQPFAFMLAYNILSVAGLSGIAILLGPAGPLLWPAVLLHAALAGLQLWSLRST